VLGVWLPAPLPTPRALPDHGALWPLAVGVEKDLGGIDVGPCGIVCCSLCGLTHPPSICVCACVYNPNGLQAIRPSAHSAHMSLSIYIYTNLSIYLSIYLFIYIYICNPSLSFY